MSEKNLLITQQYACGSSMPINLTKVLRVPLIVASVVSDEFFATSVVIETFSLVIKEKSCLRFTIFGNYVQPFRTIVATALSRTGFAIWTPSRL